MGSRTESLTRRAGADDSGRRLDKVLRRMFPGLGLSDLYGRLRKRTIRVNGKAADPAYRLIEGDIVSYPSELETGEKDTGRAADPKVAQQDLGELLVLESENLLFLNKPRGLLSHGRGGLDEIVESAMRERVESSLSFRPGPLHRLDRNTSGLIVFPRTAEGGRVFSRLLRDRQVRKRYMALLDGSVESPEVWEDILVRDVASKRSFSNLDENSGPSLLGRRAITRIVPLARGSGLTLAMLEIQTGLTHQIRAQASIHGNPLAGDSKYGGSTRVDGFVLHALAIDFPEPPFNDVPTRLIAELRPWALLRLNAAFGPNIIEKAIVLACES